MTVTRRLMTDCELAEMKAIQEIRALVGEDVIPQLNHRLNFDLQILYNHHHLAQISQYDQPYPEQIPQTQAVQVDPID